MRYLLKFVWWLIGWKVVGDIPRNKKKFIIIAAPHTSNWDFIIGVLVRAVVGFKSNFLGKKSLFKPPFGWFFKALGGYPVDRSKSTNLVDQVVEIFNEQEKFVIALAPEGTRNSAADWKTGFYYIADGAKVPIVPVKIDMKSKSVTIFDPFATMGDIDVDLPKIKELYS